MIVQTSLVEQIKDRLDIVEFIRQYVPTLKRAGKTYKACCPFHQEKTPSFTCSSEKGLFYCFGCQAGGDIVGFLMRIENLSFKEALEKLAGLAGLEYQPSHTLSAEELRRANARKALDFARNYYHKYLLSAAGEHARAYVKSRHLTKETCQHFELGLAPAVGELVRAAQQVGHSQTALQDAGLCIQTDYGLREYFRHRLMFPIINQRGDTVGFGGRILDKGEPKYLNSPETVLFSKSHVLYGLNWAGPAIRQAGKAVLLEGYMDVIGCHQAGVEYTVAPLGTSLTAQHARLLKRYTQNVIILFDPDEAGLKAALRGAMVLMEEGLFVKVASLPDGLDPDEYISQYGKERFEQILRDAQDLIAFQLSRELALQTQPLSAQAKTHIVTELSKTLVKQPDPIVRQEGVKYIAQQLAIDEKWVLQRVQYTFQSTQNAARYAPVKPVMAQAEISTPAAEENLLSWLLKSPQHMVLCSQLTAEDFSSSAWWQLFEDLVKLHLAHPQETDLTVLAAEALPQQKTEIAKLALLPVPADFNPARDIASCAARLKQTCLQKKMQTLTRQMQTYGTGNVPPEVFEQYMQLQRKLKEYRS